MRFEKELAEISNRSRSYIKVLSLAYKREVSALEWKKRSSMQHVYSEMKRQMLPSKKRERKIEETMHFSELMIVAC